ncbi:MAG: sodium:solute symporter, partial [Chthoniobacterales bacterium]
VMALSGFVIYRYRETRALTMEQFFEMRYSRNFRIYAGVLAWVSGVLYYGIFPEITSRFIIHFTGLPETFSLGGWELSTLSVVMIVMLTIAVLMATLGGQIAIMITDFLQGQFTTIVMLLILGILFMNMSWSTVLEGLRTAPAGQSLINPFDQANIPDFNIWFFLISAFISVYGFRAWQGSQGYNASALNAHEAKMAGILGEFRGIVTTLVILLIPVFIYAYLHLPQFAEQQAALQLQLGNFENPQTAEQMRVPIALSGILPTGVMGLFAAVVTFAAISTDNTYLHSWGSIFIQDVVMPFRKKPFGPKAHLWLLRGSIVFVAVFGFFWSTYFPLHEYILMYFQLTGAIFLGGAGSVILGGLYWRRGSCEGAWMGMTIGLIFAVVGIVTRNVFWPYYLPALRSEYVDVSWIQALPKDFPYNGTQMAFIAAIASILAYVIFSLLSRRPPANMEKLLHRGKYSIQGEHVGKDPQRVPAGNPIHAKRPKTFEERLGIGPEFTLGDKAIYYFKLCWASFFIIVFFAGTFVGLIYDIPNWIWEKWWGFKIGISVVLGVVTVVWFLWGGFVDLKRMAVLLLHEKVDDTDDGTVRSDEHV